MDADFVERLPADIRDFVSLIEDGIDAEISVSVDERRAARDLERRGLGCYVDEVRAEISIPTPQHFPPASVFHELLHIHRFLIERVPQIAIHDDHWDCSPEFEDALTVLDNHLEHLLIIPRELERWPERSSYWEQRVTRNLNELPNANITPEDRNRWALLQGLFVRYVLENSAAACELANVVIEQFGLEQQANEFFDAVLPVLASKEATVETCFAQLRLPAERAGLKYIDIRNRTSEMVLLAR